MGKCATCDIPEDKPELVTRYQLHKHSAYCRKKGSCRFGSPGVCSECTIIARESTIDEDQKKVEANALVILTKVNIALTDPDTPKDATVKEILDLAEVDYLEFKEALAVLERGTNVVLKRTPSACSINAYNPTILKCWAANMNLQFIVDVYACVMYIAAYMTKSERGMGELLKQVVQRISR